MLESKVVDVIGKQELLQLPADTNVAEAAKRMAKHHVGAMLVCEGEDMCGIFTERDMLERVVAADLSPSSTLLKEVMTPDPASIAAHATLLQAIFAMKTHLTRHLLVRRGDDLIGIVSVRDLLRAVVDSRLEERQRVADLWDGFPV